MTGGDQREPLWADSLANQPRRDFDGFRPEPEEAPQPRPQPDPEPDPGRPAGQRAVAAALVAAITMVTVAMTLAGRSSLTIEDVPSFWDDVRMTCHTTRLEQGDRAVELFRCRAVDGGTLPPGLYRSPEAQWTSDLTRRDARVNEIEISPRGELEGWAAY